MESLIYNFELLDTSLPSLKNKDVSEYLKKWNLDAHLKTWTFSFDKAYNVHTPKEFIKNFITNTVVMSALKSNINSSFWSKDLSNEELKVEPLQCSLTSMNFFDRLIDNDIVKESGSISKCFDEMYEGILISDELRKMLLDEDSINFECYSDEERSELLFKLFKMFVIGGRICQYEDMIAPYHDVTKSLYKDLVCVQKDPSSNTPTVASKAFQISIVNEKKKLIFPSDTIHEQSFAYIVVNPVKRRVHILHHNWGKNTW